MGYLEGKVLYGGISRCEFCGFSAQRSIGFGRIQKSMEEWYEESIRIG